MKNLVLNKYYKGWKYNELQEHILNMMEDDIRVNKNPTYFRLYRTYIMEDFLSTVYFFQKNIEFLNPFKF